MNRNYYLPFKLGDEVEAKFNEAGYRGAWFRCRIREIKESTPDPSLLLEYVDFPDEDHSLYTSFAYSWTRVRQPDPSVKTIEPWLKQKKPLIWMVRPKPPIVHESNVEKYQEDITFTRKCADYMYIYNDVYMVGDSVDFYKDDCFWAAQIVEIITETNEAKIKFPLPPVGEGDGDLHLVSFKDLRPSFSWNPGHWWRQLGLKKKEGGPGVEKCDKPHIQLVYLSGDSMNPATFSKGRCELIPLGDSSSVRKSEHDELTVNSCGNRSDSHELVVTSERLREDSKCAQGPLQSTSDACQEHDVVYDRVKLLYNCTGDGSNKQKAPNKVKLETYRRKVQFTSSFVLSDSDEEEQGSWATPRNLLAKAGEISPSHDSEMVSEFEVLNVIFSTTHTLRLDASTAPSHLAAMSSTGTRGEMDSYSEHLRDGTAVGDLVNDSGAAANEEIPQAKFVIPGTALENEVSATSGSPGNLDGRNIADSSSELVIYTTTLPVKSDGSCLRIENIDVLGDRMAEVDGDSTSDVRSQAHIFVPGNASENPSSLGSMAGCADDLSGARAEEYSSALDRVTAPREQITDSKCDFYNIEAEDARSENSLQVHLVVSAETSMNVENLRSTDILVAHSMKITEEPNAFEGVTGLVHQSAPEHGTPIPENTTGDGNHGENEACALGGDLSEEQATGSRANVVTKDASAPLCGRTKWWSHRSCVAIQKAIDIGRSRKRRRGKDRSKNSRKRLCQAYKNRTVVLCVSQANGFMEEPSSSSVPPTPSHDERKSSVFGTIVKLEPGTYEDENRMHAVEDPNFEPLWVIALPRIGAGKLSTVIHASITPSGEAPSWETPSGEAPSGDALSGEVPIGALNVEAAISEAPSAEAPSGTGQLCSPDSTENGDLEDHIDALERLSARVHVLGAHLLSDKMKKRKKIVWKISDGSVVCSGEREGVIFDEEPIVTQNCSELDCVSKSFPQNVIATEPEKAPDVEAGAHHNITKRRTKRKRSIRSLSKRKSQGSRQPKSTNKCLLLKSQNPQVKGGLKRKQVDDMGPRQNSKKAKANASTALVEAAQNFSAPAAVELPKMRGSIKLSQGRPVRLKESKILQEHSLPEKLLNAIIGRKDQLVEPVNLQQEQLLKDPVCEDIEQESVENPLLSGFPTNSHLSGGSNHEISSLVKSGLQAFEGESKERQSCHQSKRNSDFEVLDNESEENKVKLQPNGKWCMKALTVDGKVEWIGSYSTKEEALSIFHVVNCPSSLKEKGVPSLIHTSSLCFREQAGGNRVSYEPPSNEKQLKCSTPSKRTQSDASEFSSRIIEPNVESTVFIAKEVNEPAVGISRLDKTSGADSQEGDGQDTDTLESDDLNKLAETCEQDSLAISIEEGAHVGPGVEMNSELPTEGDLQGRCLTEGLLGLSSKEVVNVPDKDTQPGEIVQDEPLVKVERPVPQAPQAQVVPAGGSAHDSWVHDAVRCRYGKNVLDRVSTDGFETTEEKEVACQMKMELWKGMCCSSQSGSLGLDLFQRIQLFVLSKMHFHREIDDRMLLSTGKPGEVIYLGNCKNDIEAAAARRILSRCKKEFQKCISFFQRQPLQSSRAVAQPGDPSPKVIVLDDDDGNEVQVAPVASLLSGSTSARAFTDVASLTNNISVQREDTVQGNRACRTYGLLSNVVSSHPRETQEEHRHMAGGSSAGRHIGVRQTVPNYIQITDTSAYPMQSVGLTRGSSNAQMHGRTLQPVLQGPGIQHTAPTPFVFGNAVRQQQPMNQFDGCVFLDSSGRRVEIPSNHSQPIEGPVRAFTSHGLVNLSRELGNSTPVPTTPNISAAAAPRSTSMRRVYNCCPGSEASNKDFMLFKALCCMTCDRLVHTDCAIALHQLRLVKYLGKERAVYTCKCNKIWEIIPQILNRMKEFINLIWNQQKERLNRDSAPLTVIEFEKGQDLNVIMGTLYKTLAFTRDPGLKSILDYVKCMNRNMWVDVNRVNFLEWIQFLEVALRFVHM